jgi:hypothetical protein
MAKRSRALPTAGRDEESLLLRSAESLGRMIGSLQRQLDKISRASKSAPRANASKGSSARNNAGGAKKPRRR